jgi:hypothetical protein
LRQHGVSIAEQTSGFSQTYNIFGTEDNIPWTFDLQMHIASLSKNITAMAMTQILNSLGLPPTTAISAYLPTYWKRGLNINLITFSDLLTHTSGLTSRATDYESMKSAIHDGVSTHGMYQYANMNFSLCRILLSVLNGSIAPDFDLQLLVSTSLLDSLWDIITLETFGSYVTNNVLTPAGSGGHLVHQFGDALAYDYPPSPAEIGWSDGDLTVTLGAAGWHMSINQLLDVMGAFRRAGNILPPCRRRQCLRTVSALIGL